MASQKMTQMDWKAERSAQENAGKQADALTARMKLSCPIDPFMVAKDEHPRLRIGGRNFGSRFDGKLKYVLDEHYFALMYNTKYDINYAPGEHHPRTRFTIAHELGHYHIRHHREYLRHRKTSHASVSEFQSSAVIEKEADAFAASLLLPTHLVKPIVNRGNLSLNAIDRIAGDFGTSRVSTSIRSVQLSHFPCAVAGIRNGSVAWMFSSEPLIEAGIYPNRGVMPANAREPWDRCRMGVPGDSEDGGEIQDWFQTYQREHLDDVYVHEEYVPVSSMETLLVLLTIDESEIAIEDEEDDTEDGH